MQNLNSIWFVGLHRIKSNNNQITAAISPTNSVDDNIRDKIKLFGAFQTLRWSFQRLASENPQHGKTCAGLYRLCGKIDRALQQGNIGQCQHCFGQFSH